MDGIELAFKRQTFVGCPAPGCFYSTNQYRSIKLHYERNHKGTLRLTEFVDSEKPDKISDII